MTLAKRYGEAVISIHALLAESDRPNPPERAKEDNFYPRSPCGERPAAVRVDHIPLNFYPRSPCGERPARPERQRALRHFYPRSPCGERLPGNLPKDRSNRISIHALLAESDAIFGQNQP